MSRPGKDSIYYTILSRMIFITLMATAIAVLWLLSFPPELEIEFHDIINESIFIILIFIIYIIILLFRAKIIIIEIGWLLFLLKSYVDLIDEFTNDPDLFGSYIPNIVGFIGLSLAIIGIFIAYQSRTKQLDESIRIRGMLKLSEERYKNILANIEECYFEFSNSGRLLFFNDSLCRTLQYSREELLDMSFAGYIDEKELEKLLNIFDEMEERGKKSKSFDIELVRKDGSRLQAELSISAIYDDDGEKLGYRGVARDVTERRKVEEVNAYLAYHDTLTGIYNRLAFNQHLKEAVSYAAEFQTRLAVFYLDLDNFKQVNDGFSHDIGDKILCAVTGRVKSVIRKSDLLFRLGGDEFTILFSNIEELDLDMIARKLTEQLSNPYKIEGELIDFVGVSIGISVYPDDAADCQTLLNCADTTMYKAKRRGNSFSYYKKKKPPFQL